MSFEVACPLQKTYITAQCIGTKYLTACVLEKPRVEIGVAIANDGDVTFIYLVDEVRGMLEDFLDLQAHRQAHKVGRLVMGYLVSRVPGCPAWCRVKGRGQIGVTFWVGEET